MGEVWFCFTGLLNKHHCYAFPFALAMLFLFYSGDMQDITQLWGFVHYWKRRRDILVCSDRSITHVTDVCGIKNKKISENNKTFRKPEYQKH